MQKVIERLKVLRGRQLPPAPALAIAVAVGLMAASVLTAALEAVFAVYWWTALLYMAAFFAAAISTYRRISPQGARLAAAGGRRYLEDSGTLEVIDAARDLSGPLATKE